MLFSILLGVMVVLGIVIVALILLQQGKGADAGAAFGSGASGTVFGSRGSGGFLSRTTGVLMALFMVLAVVMAWMAQHSNVQGSSLMSGVATQATAAAPAPTHQSAPAVRTTALPSTTSSATTGTSAGPLQKDNDGVIRHQAHRLTLK